jgi:hypothetical protein
MITATDCPGTLEYFVGFGAPFIVGFKMSLLVMKDPGSNLGADICSFGY